MKVVLLAGGFGTRISEESLYRPKPMIEIGGMPIIWHIMKEYAYYGFNEFVICAGYKQNVIKEWFSDYFINNSDVTFDFRGGERIIEIHDQHIEPWKVTVVDTGLNTMTGGRIKRIQKYIGNEPFFMTYGDGVCDVNIEKLLEFHNSHGKYATLTAVMQDQQKGVLNIGGNNAVKSFREKSMIRYHEDLLSAIGKGYTKKEIENLIRYRMRHTQLVLWFTVRKYGTKKTIIGFKNILII